MAVALATHHANVFAHVLFMWYLFLPNELPGRFSELRSPPPFPMAESCGGVCCPSPFDTCYDASGDKICDTCCPYGVYNGHAVRSEVQHCPLPRIMVGKCWLACACQADTHCHARSSQDAITRPRISVAQRVSLSLSLSLSLHWDTLPLGQGSASAQPRHCQASCQASHLPAVTSTPAWKLLV